MGCTRLMLCFLALTAAYYETQAAADCETLVQEYYEFNRKQLTPYRTDYLYFLRTPQTYSRELEACIVRPAVVGTQRCPSFNEQIDDNAFSRLKGCNVLSSSDDLSILQSIFGSTAVAAQLRDPVDRLVSAYELAVEVAVQKLDSAKAKNPFEAMQKQHPSNGWPWSQFSAFLSKDLMQRVKKLKEADEEDDDLSSVGNWVELYDSKGESFFMHTITDDSKDALTDEERAQLLPALDPYNNELVMPLKDFVKHPKVLQLLHNGELLQVLGLTNTSRFAKAKELRSCIRKNSEVADEMFKYATRRLDSFAFVGVGEDLHSSAEVAAAALDRPLNGPAYVPGELFIPGVKKVKVMSFTGGMKPDSASSPAKDLDVEGHDAMTIDELKAEIEVKEEAAKKMYDETYDMFVKGTASKAEIAAARAKVSSAKAAVMQLKFDLEQMEGQKDLDKKLDGTLGAEFHTCAKKYQEAATKQTLKTMVNLAMPDGRQIKFSPEARKNIPEETLAEIRNLNALDIKLVEHAKQLFEKKRKELEAAGKLQKLPAPLATAADGADATKTEEL